MMNNKSITTFFLLGAAAAVVMSSSTAVVVAEEYVNPCEEFDTAKTLNDLFYDTTPKTTSSLSNGEEEEQQQPSYYTSGFFVHGQDAGGGVDLSDPGADPITPGKYITLPSQNFTLGSDALRSPVCPVDIIQDGEYPWYCPTPLSMNADVISFTYIRNDIAPPISILKEYNETGVDPYTNSNETGKPNPGAWGGPGYIISPMVSNPEIVNNDDTAAFWGNDRVGYSYTTDGSTWSRIDCGNGVSISEMLLGDKVPFDDAGPVVDPATAAIMQCSPRTDAWKNYASKPKGWDEGNYCPEESFADYETYTEYNYNKLSTYQSSITATAEDCEQFMEEATSGGLDSLDHNLYGQCLIQSAPQQVMCGIPPEKFDEIYIPAQKFENWPEGRQNLAEQGLPAFISGGREVSIEPWNGVGFNEFGNHMVFYANYGDDQSVQDALDHANDFYEKSQLNGGSPIRIPVVIMNPDNMWLQDDDDDDTQLLPFTCPTTPHTSSSKTIKNGSDEGIDSSSSSSSSAISFLQVGNIAAAALLSSAFTFAVAAL